MPLTPEDVSNKRFMAVRLREGYDMGEVDAFLDEVEAELERLLKEGADLREKLSAAQGGAPVPAPAAAPPPVAAVDAPADAAAEESGDSVSAAATAPRETIKVVTPAEASSAALRLLELATKNADEVVAEAKEEADQIVGDARTEAERLRTETKATTDNLEQEARARAQNLESETEVKRSELLGDMQQEKARLDSEVETLRAFEREYRSRLKSYFAQQLEALDGIGEGGDLAEQGDSSRLRSVLSQHGGHEKPAEDPAASPAESHDSDGRDSQQD